MTDPISDMLTRIRNSAKVNKEEIQVPYSSIKLAILEILKREGYVKDVKKSESGKFPVLEVVLDYEEGVSKINAIKRVSRPSQRVYVDKNKIPRSKQGLGKMVISTSKGLMTDKEARRQKVGGEVLFEVW